LAIVRRGANNFNPDYFSFIMATGIISIGAYLLSLTVIAQVLLIINLIFYVVFWLLLIVRFIFNLPSMLEYMKTFSISASIFAVVAGTCVLGSQFGILMGWIQAAYLVWLFGIVLWIILIYYFFFTMITSEKKPALETGINGSWLITVVSTQSISVLGSLVTPDFLQFRDIQLFITLSMYLVGSMLYLLLFTLIFYRLLYFRLSPEALTPAYWIGMGAAAITTLAGDGLMLNISGSSFLSNILPFIEGLTFFFWAFATWLIPLLVVLGVWRHLVKRVPIFYDPQQWGFVFPLGMYTVSTFLLAKATQLNFLKIIPQFFIYIALIAWLAVMFGLVFDLVRGLWSDTHEGPTTGMSK
jgi:tellurite resistance protein TehA-like permease